MPNIEAQNFLRKMLQSMDRWGASDVFVTVDKNPAARVNGQVVPVELGPTSQEFIDAFIDEVVPFPHMRRKFEECGDLDVGYSHDTGKRFRFNLSRHMGRTNIVIRALPPGDVTFEQLGLPPVFETFCELPRGLFLVTGATGSGKSTTLAAMIHHMNVNRKLHIVTIEEPIEFVHVDRRSRVTQREVGIDTLSFTAALKSVVRQSPDVIVVGEMRDYDTMKIALAAALTGHLVLATVHTIDTTQTLQRLLTYFPEDAREQAALDLSLSLQGIVAQRLMPSVDGRGRQLAIELMTMTPPARRFVRDQRLEEVYDLMRSSNDPGMITFNQSLLAMYRDNRVSYDIARAYSTNPDEFALSAQGMATGVASLRGLGSAAADAGMDMKALLEVVNHHGASDLHVTVGRPPILRIDGIMRTLDVPPLSASDMRVLLFSILSSNQRSTYEITRELDFALSLESGRRFRVNAYYQKGNMAASLRTIASSIPPAEKLGLPPSVVALGERPHGLLLVVGPTGSGKSTTLACMVDRINRSRTCRIITVEDPIEFVHESQLATVDQREVESDTRSFAAALKFVLRQDPDVILVGEMRDLETIQAAITAAETGHLVLATLHTNDAIQAIDRIIDVFPSHQQAQIRSMLSASLLGVVSQRLLPRKGGGRVGVFEVMVANSALRTLIRDNKMHQALSTMEAGFSEGMVTMDRALKDLYAAGIIELDDAMRYVRNPKSLIPAPQAPLMR
jgi:twitching motility protein PilT